MKIAISNIAWQQPEEENIARLMQDLGIAGVEIAPTKIWQSPLIASDRDIYAYRDFWQRHDIEIVAMQALLFGRNDLTIFQDAVTRQETLRYLAGTIELGSKLGAKALIFGSPKNRKIGDLERDKAQEIARSFFSELGEIAAKYQLFFCIEPNPTVYGCDFVNTSQEGLELVTQTNSKGFGLHLDAAGMSLSGENIVTALNNCHHQLCHFHISEPYLGQIGEGGVEHRIFADTLSRLNYDRWVSIEMRAVDERDNLAPVTRALETAIRYYG